MIGWSGAFAMNRPPAIPRWTQHISDGISWDEARQLAE
jgi:hypothetical protein